MKAITIYQPYAALLTISFDGIRLKNYETRSRNYKYRGPLAIHSASSSTHAMDGEDWTLIQSLNTELGLLGKPQLDPSLFIVYGSVIAIGHMSKCKRMDSINYGLDTFRLERMTGNWAPDRYAIQINNLVTLGNPIELPGKQGLWDFNLKDHFNPG